MYNQKLNFLYINNIYPTNITEHYPIDTMGNSRNPYSPHDPKFGMAPNPLYYMYELSTQYGQYKQMKKMTKKDFIYHKENNKIINMNKMTNASVKKDIICV